MNQLEMFPDARTDDSSLSNIKFSSNTAEWYTPGGVAMAATLVMGGIELDPASSPEANETIKAERFYTKDDDGLKKSWKARSVWLNPPYGKYKGQSNQGRWSKRLVYEYQQESFGQACLLVGFYSGYRWFTDLVKLSAIAHELCGEEVLSRDYDGFIPMPPICMTYDLLRFKSLENGDMGKAKAGSAIFGFGVNTETFKREFSRFGFIIGV